MIGAAVIVAAGMVCRFTVDDERVPQAMRDVEAVVLAVGRGLDGQPTALIGYRHPIGLVKLDGVALTELRECKQP